MLVDYSIFSGPGIVLGIVAGLLLIVSVIAVVRSQRRRVTVGQETMIGQNGVVQTALHPEGTVQVNGELWNARVRGGHLDPGSRVVVVGVDRLVLTVKEKEVTDD
jgi:membrane-bound serine protease (ClpP class)